MIEFYLASRLLFSFCTDGLVSLSVNKALVYTHRSISNCTSLDCFEQKHRGIEGSNEG